MEPSINLFIGILCAFVGGYFAKSIELQNEFGDYYYFLRSSKKVRWYCTIYGFSGVLFLLLLSYSNFVSKEYIPEFNFDLQPPRKQGVSIFYIIGTSIIVGFTSKGVLDMPIAKARSTDEMHFKLKDVVAFLFPDIKRSFQNIIRSNELNYLAKVTQGIQQMQVKDVAKKAYDWLRDKNDWKTNEKQRELDILMNELKQFDVTSEALRYLYRNLGREEFEFAFELNK